MPAIELTPDAVTGKIGILGGGLGIQASGMSTASGWLTSLVAADSCSSGVARKHEAMHVLVQLLYADRLAAMPCVLNRSSDVLRHLRTQ